MIKIFFIISIILICIQLICSFSLYRIRKYEYEISDNTLYNISHLEALCGFIGWVMLAIITIESLSDTPIFWTEEEYEVRV